MGSSRSIGEILATTLSDLGRPSPADIIQTVLLKDRYFVGYKYRYEGGYAILRAGSNAIEFFDENGTPLTTVTMEADKGAAA